MFGGQVGVAGHMTIGNKVRVQAQTGIGHRVKDGEKLYGSPAIDYGNYVKSYVHFKNLPKIVSQLNKLEKGKKFDYKDRKSVQAKKYKDGGFSSSDFYTVDLQNIQSPGQ